MKKIYTLLFSALLLTNFSQAQQELQKNEVYAKIMTAINNYEQTINFSKSDVNSKQIYENKVHRLFVPGAAIINDLPIQGKKQIKISPARYLNLLYENFPDGLTVQIERGSIDYKKDQTTPRQWNGSFSFVKKLSGLTKEDNLNSLDIKLQMQLELKDNGDFLITSIQAPNDQDADGIKDAEDACPQISGFMTPSGCPDSDNDGVPDHLDQCPNTPLTVEVVDEKGCEKVSFFKDVTLHGNILTGVNRLQHFEAKDKAPEFFKINDFKKWEDGNSQPGWPLSISFDMKATKPIMKLGPNQLALSSGLGIYNFKSKLFIYETSGNTSFPEISDYSNGAPDFELTKLNYLGIPIGLKFIHEFFYSEIGINSLFSLGGNRELLDEKNNTILDDDDIGKQIKTFKPAPYALIGIEREVTDNILIHGALGYTFLHKFSNYSNKDFNLYNEEKKVTEKNELPATIEMVKDGLTLHAVKFNLGISYLLD